ncbi:MAG: RecQ family ATP-dependent DNA helicase [Gammaproteobacteria bacterium]|nr:RecQ family ATP-dependent DNA helicase [Gammaproteobacteria bacterium]
MQDSSKNFAHRCIAIDLEVHKKTNQILSIGAYRPESESTLFLAGKQISKGLIELDRFASGTEFLLGHNLILFDHKYLQAFAPNLDLLQRPCIDTLWLNPLAFPKNPYHKLIKHYQDPIILGDQCNDPVQDARLTVQILFDQQDSFQNTTERDLLDIFHGLTSSDPNGKGFDAFLKFVRNDSIPSIESTKRTITNWLSTKGCLTHCEGILDNLQTSNWALAYALAWISVAGGNSVIPSWVFYNHPETVSIIRKLRDIACNDPKCVWCQKFHNPKKELKRWFGFDNFRSEPIEPQSGRPMQEVIVESSMSAKHALGILPTGTGKSLCYQLPGLSRYFKTGALTVVISPLVALMADQVDGMEKNGITCAATINGMLSYPERSETLDLVRLGDVGILIISPEQLRNRTVRKTLRQRQIGTWVIDEAHCLSKWGHDFRPDYRYLARFIEETSDGREPAPILALTATAKPEVKGDLAQHFHDKLKIDMEIYDGGSSRTNLEFMVVQTDLARKPEDVYQILELDLLNNQQGSAIVYCAFRKDTEDMAEFLRLKGVSAEHFHSQLTPDSKKTVQSQFIDGKIRVIVATNAFGMGIDKPDVRLVIHADIPGSLENYMQEAGRAGRDRNPARCVLLFTMDDIDKQFGMSARSRLTRREIASILRALRKIDTKNRKHGSRNETGEVVVTSGEILLEDDEGHFVRDETTNDTRVKTAISWLEDAILLTREENRVQIFPSSLLIGSIEDAKSKLDGRDSFTPTYRRNLLDITRKLIHSNPDEGISTDELMGITGFTLGKLQEALSDLEYLGIANNDTPLTAYIHVGVERSSLQRFTEAMSLEVALIDYLREDAPDLSVDESSTLHIRSACQRLRDDNIIHVLPERLLRILRGLSQDGRDDQGRGSLDLRSLRMEEVSITLRRDWKSLHKTAQLRRDAAYVLLQHWLERLPNGARGTDLLVDTTWGGLRTSLTSDLELKTRVKKMDSLLRRSLMWLHEMEVLRIDRGLAIFQPAMTLRLEQGKPRRYFLNVDFKPLQDHYQNQVLQVHVMAEYARKGLENMADAVRLSIDYFTLGEEEFLARWMAEREGELKRQTTNETWQKIVQDLHNPIQKLIVADDRQQQNVLVLAGPGSGKTRALVHRIAYLVRIRRENPRGIIALTYNRHAAQEIRQRLHELIGLESRPITIMTCHALAMRLVGASFSARLENSTQKPNQDQFSKILLEATDLLEGKGLPEDDADDQRERLLHGFRWILVDEYQDIDSQQYNLISALAGRTRDDPDRKLTLFAVGDDDQNIYTFNGASVEFIKRFENDYELKLPNYLVENYRSTKHIIEVANEMIRPAANRMKKEMPIQIDRSRRKEPQGGAWQSLDPVTGGRVQLFECPADPVSQALAILTEFQRLSTLSSGWDWSRCAIIAREWQYLNPVRTVCETIGIPVQTANEENISIWKLRETQTLVHWLRERNKELVSISEIEECLEQCHNNVWRSLLYDAVTTLRQEVGSQSTGQIFIEWLAEWSREARKRQTGLLLLTAHRAKGLEFDHVAVLDGGWCRSFQNDDRDAERRLYYVAMTRARQTLHLVCFKPESSSAQDTPGSRALFTEAFLTHPSVIVNKLPRVDGDRTGLERIYTLPKLSQINLGFAGRLNGHDHVSIKAIQGLSIGETLTLRKRNIGAWELLNSSGNQVGYMARDYSPPEGYHPVYALVYAVVVWRRDANPNDEYGAKRDAWEVVVPEIIYEPCTDV